MPRPANWKSDGPTRLDPREPRGRTIATWNEEAREIRTENETYILAPGKRCDGCRLNACEFAGDNPCDFCGPDEVFR